MTPLDFNCFINASDEKDLHEKIRTLIHKIKPKWDSNHLKLNVSCFQNTTILKFYF